MQAGDQLIAVAEESEGFCFEKKRPDVINPAHIYLEPYDASVEPTQRVLMCGWGDTLGRYLKMLNVIFSPGTEVSTPPPTFQYICFFQKRVYRCVLKSPENAMRPEDYHKDHNRLVFLVIQTLPRP